MRFSLPVVTGALLLSPLGLAAQETSPPPDPAAAAAAAPEAPATPEPPKVFKQDKPCMDNVSDELIASFGEITAWPAEVEEMYMPEGLSTFGHPVAYVLVKHNGPGGKIDEIDYRLQGMQRTVGQPHDAALLRAFDKEFKGASCAKSKESSCGVAYKTDKGFSGAEIGSGEIDVGDGARGPQLAMVQADYDLLDSDPVFLACYYRRQ